MAWNKQEFETPAGISRADPGGAASWIAQAGNGDFPLNCQVPGRDNSAYHGRIGHPALVEVPMKLTAHTEAPDALGYRDLCQKHIDGLWIPEHLTPQEAAAFALDHFKRAVPLDGSYRSSPSTSHGQTDSTQA